MYKGIAKIIFFVFFGHCCGYLFLSLSHTNGGLNPKVTFTRNIRLQITKVNLAIGKDQKCRNKNRFEPRFLGGSFLFSGKSRTGARLKTKEKGK